MATNKTKGRPTDEPQDIEALKDRYEELKHQKTVAETNHTNAKKELAKLQKQAHDAYGTDDLVQLRAKLKDMTEANLKKRRDYEAALDKIEEDLKKVDDQYKVVQDEGGKA